MSSEFDALKAALGSAPPAPDADRKAEALALAMKNFDLLQGSPLGLRPMEDRPKQAGFFQGVKAMLTAIKTRPWLTATTSAAALALGMVVFLPVADMARLREVLVPPSKPDVVKGLESPVDAEAKAKKAAGGEAELDQLLVESRDQALTPTEAAPNLQPELDGRMEALPEPMMDAAPAPRAALREEAEPQIATGGALEESFADGLAATSIMEPAVGLAIAADSIAPPEPNTEAFADAAVNPVKITVEEPVSTFFIDVDTASYAVVRSSLNAGYLPPPEAVRIEEMVNYFPYAYPKPEGDQAFASTISVMPTPWNPATRLVHIGIQGAMPALADRPALNLVFLIDTSGSMEAPNKLPLLKQSFALMLAELRPTDQVAIVAYAGSAGEVLAPTAAKDRAKILAALDRLDAGGSTAGAEGIALAYQVAEGMKADGEISRVILATDGDFNVGIDDPDALKTYIETKRDSGTYLSVLGFGRGNLDDATMQALAQNGNGTAAYIDTLNEARKVLVDQLTGALFPIADNVKIQVEWNPAEVAEYRLIGYETRALAREDFNNDKVDAGDIGAGTSVTAIYEITAPGSAALLNDPLRYQTQIPASETGELGFLRIRHVASGGSASTLQETPIHGDTGAAGDDALFSAAIAGFGQLLSGAKYTGDWGWDEAIEMALAARGSDDFGYRIEAVNLMRLAQSLSGG
jgi:Ca-activated chloride channel family protein